jgi:hypothetical protein
VKLILEFAPSVLQTSGVEPQQFLSKLKALNLEVNVISDRGLLPLESFHLPDLLTKIRKNGGYVNLFCSPEEVTEIHRHADESLLVARIKPPSPA